MQTSHFFLKRSLLLLSLFPFFFIIVSISSCGTTDHNNVLKVPENCITISRTQIHDNMLSGGWSVPTNDNFVPYFYFDPSKTAGGIEVIAYPADRENHLFAARRANMKILSMEPACGFPPNLNIIRNRYDFSALGFADDHGRLIEFDFLRLVPRACTEPGYTSDMVFDVYTVTRNSEGIEIAIQKAYTKPCPPYCPVQ